MSELDSRARITAGRAFARLGIGATWGVVMVALIWGAAWLGIWLVNLTGGPAWGVAGLACGVTLAVVICRHARMWIQRLRLRLMGARAVTVIAAVHRVDRYHTYGMAPNRTIYTVWFAWTDAAGTAQMRERQYGFYGSGLREFEVRVADGAQVPIRYPAGHPSRFIADIPYSATMADQII